MSTAEQFSAFREAAPWRVRVSDTGDALVVARWREHLDLLAIRGLWSAPHRLGELLDDARAVARAQGFARVLSPLVTGDAREAYLRLGMTEVEGIVALQGHAADVAAGPVPDGARVRAACAADMAALLLVDAQCFGEFWRYGTVELAECFATERIALAETDDGAEVIGYSTCALHGATATLGRLAVAPGHRRRGVGAALLGDAAVWAVRHGAFAFTLCTQEDNAASRSLYAAAGLHELPERYSLAACDASTDAAQAIGEEEDAR
jgi:ribosomal-protein-alanine N-acetyltransferase